CAAQPAAQCVRAYGPNQQQPRRGTLAMSDIPSSHEATGPIRRPRRWHIGVFLLPAFIVYSAVMILPLIETLRLSLFNTVDGQPAFVGLGNFKVLFVDERWAADFWNALKNNVIFFAIHM